jgi:hypothetical protein
VGVGGGDGELFIVPLSLFATPLLSPSLSLLHSSLVSSRPLVFRGLQEVITSVVSHPVHGGIVSNYGTEESRTMTTSSGEDGRTTEGVTDKVNAFGGFQLTTKRKEGGGERSLRGGGEGRLDPLGGGYDLLYADEQLLATASNVIGGVPLHASLGIIAKVVYLLVVMDYLPRLVCCERRAAVRVLDKEDDVSVRGQVGSLRGIEAGGRVGGVRVLNLSGQVLLPTTLTLPYPPSRESEQPLGAEMEERREVRPRKCKASREASS